MPCPKCNPPQNHSPQVGTNFSPNFHSEKSPEGTQNQGCKKVLGIAGYFCKEGNLCPECQNHSPHGGCLPEKRNRVKLSGEGTQNPIFNLSEKRRKLYSSLNDVRLGKITIYDMMDLIRNQDKTFIKKEAELLEILQREYITWGEFKERRDKLAGEELCK